MTPRWRCSASIARRSWPARLKAGKVWEDNDLVFCREDGSPWRPDYVTRGEDSRAAREQGSNRRWVNPIIGTPLAPTGGGRFRPVSAPERHR